MAWLDYDGLLYFWQKIKAKLADKVDKVDGKGLSTNDFSAAYKAKLDGIANGANNYSHPTSSGNKHIPAGGSAGQILRWSSDGTAQWGNDNNTTYSAFKGATSSAAGGSGLVPAPTTTNATQYLRGDGGRHLFCSHRRIEQLYSVGNAHVEAGSCRCVICDWYGTCCGYPAESNAWFAYLGLLFPAIQSAWSNLSAIYCVMVLPCFVVHLCR